MMQLNIKDPETHAMVTRLADATGLSRSRVVKDAVRARLAEIDGAREAEIARRLSELRQLTAEIRARLPNPLPTQREMDDRMYGEDGLPR